MKTIRTLITISLLLTAATLFAQTENNQLMKVTVPFAFAAGNQSLPSGEYLIYTVTPQRSIRIVSADGKHSAIVNTLPNYRNSPSSKSALVFHRYGSEYFLAQVRTAGQNLSRDPLSSKRAMEIAVSGGTPETFAIFALAEGR